MVHRRAQRAGLGAHLMRAIEQQARDAGFTLLTLDAKRGAGAEQLYRRLGWTYVGAIPDFAFDTDGVTPHDAVIFYRTFARGVISASASPGAVSSATPPRRRPGSLRPRTTRAAG